jgi:hypothetical protein
MGASEPVPQNEHLSNNFFVSNYCTELHKDLADSFVTEIRSQTDGCSHHIRHFYFIKYIFLYYIYIYTHIYILYNIVQSTQLYCIGKG